MLATTPITVDYDTYAVFVAPRTTLPLQQQRKCKGIRLSTWTNMAQIIYLCHHYSQREPHSRINSLTSSRLVLPRKKKILLSTVHLSTEQSNGKSSIIRLRLVTSFLRLPSPLLRRSTSFMNSWRIPDPNFLWFKSSCCYLMLLISCSGRRISPSRLWVESYSS